MKSSIFLVLLFAYAAQSRAQNEFMNALVLDGDGDFVEVPDHPSIDIGVGDDFTMEAWFKTTSNAQTRLLFKVAPGPFGYAMFVDFGKVWTLTWTPARPAFSVIAPSGFNIPPEDLYNNDVWHHAAFVREGSNMSVYVDGELMQTRSDAIAEDLSNGANLGIGARPPDGTGSTPFYFTGSIDEVRIWKVGRTQEQIRADMFQPLDESVYGDPASGLAAYYRFDEVEDLGVGDPGANDIRDLSVNGNHGDLKGDAALDYVGDDDFSEPLLTLQFREMNPHIGQKLEVRVIDKDRDREVGRKTIDAVPTADFDVSMNVLLKGHVYDIDFYADLSANGTYDAPPDDHAWRLTLDPAAGSDTITFVHGTDFVDIAWLPKIRGFNYANYEAIWSGVGRNDNGGFDFSLVARYISNGDAGTVDGYVEASNVFGFFDLVLVYFSGAYSEMDGTGEVVPVDAPPGKTAHLPQGSTSRTLTLSGSTDWTGTLTWEDGGDVSADFLYTAMGMNIDISVDGLMGKTQGILNYHSDHFEVDGKMLVQEDSVISASTVGTAVETEGGRADRSSTLSQNFPNPAFANTTIPFRLRQASQVTIKLYDLLGREVVTLLDESMIEGSHSVSFYLAFLPSGLYVLRMAADQEDGTRVEDSKKLVVLKQ